MRNPEDARLFVQDRFNSMNYTTNLGRPAGRYLVGGICAGVLVLLIWMCVSFSADGFHADQNGERR